MQSSSTAKSNFKAMSLTDFWAKYVHIYKSVSVATIPTLLPFSSVYIAKTVFLPRYKDKTGTKLDCEADLRCVICYKVAN